ncbi:MAG: hypothetical protein KDK23_01865 [Leptospiraceae bacterium]|nr:hypothetical protein [Leptospiraceae bacterium]
MRNGWIRSIRWILAAHNESGNSPDLQAIPSGDVSRVKKRYLPGHRPPEFTYLVRYHDR